MMAKRGSKLSKSENAQVRLDPVLKWAADIASGNDRRSLSSYIEIAVENAVKQSFVAHDETGATISAWEIAHRCWHIMPGMRIKLLAEQYPSALSTKEFEIVQAIEVLYGKSDTDWLYRSPVAWKLLTRFANDEIGLRELSEAIDGLKTHSMEPSTCT